MRRSVPERLRVTSDSVSAQFVWYLTPWSTSPSVTPVAAKKTSSLRTRSDAEYAVERRAGRFRFLFFFGIASVELALDLPAQAFQRRSGQHRFRRASDPHQEVETRAIDRGHDGARHVAVADQLDAGARVADFLD